jgi:hypothetical protein
VEVFEKHVNEMVDITANAEANGSAGSILEAL